MDEEKLDKLLAASLVPAKSKLIQVIGYHLRHVGKRGKAAQALTNKALKKRKRTVKTPPEWGVKREMGADIEMDDNNERIEHYKIQAEIVANTKKLKLEMPVIPEGNQTQQLTVGKPEWPNSSKATPEKSFGAK